MCHLKPARHLGQDFGARLDVAAMHFVGPDRAGIVDIGVDVAGGERVEDDAGAEPVAARAPKGHAPLSRCSISAASTYCSVNGLAPMT